MNVLTKVGGIFLRLSTFFIGFFCLLISLFTCAPSAFADEAIITSDQLNIRSGPGTNFDVVGQANTGDTFTIISEQDDWVQIQLESTATGWVINDYITIDKEPVVADKEEIQEEIDTPSDADKTITIRFDNTQLREGPSTEFEIIDFATKNTQYDVVSETDGWYEISRDDFNGYVLKQLVDQGAAKTSPTLKNKTIVIDAGHGGRDVGAIGATGIFEKDIVYLTAQQLEQELTMLGANVLLTRPEDEFIALGSRSAFSNTMQTDAFISLHYNSVPEFPNVSGIETYYYSEPNDQLATDIQQEIIKETNANDRGTTEGDFAVLRQNLQPGVLIELGFISNPQDESLLSTNAYQQKIVSGIANGLRKYFAH